MLAFSDTLEFIDAERGVDQPTRLSDHEKSKQVLLSYEVDKYTESRLNQLRSALHSQYSVRFNYSDQQKTDIEQAIATLIGEPKAGPTKQPVPRKRRRFVVTDMDLSFLDGCNPVLREILINRFPRRPYSSDQDDYLDNCPRRLDSALKKKRIQFNPPGTKSFIVVDVDRAITEFECEDAGLPLPTWISINPANGHAHFVWALQNPVWSGGENQKPARYFNAIQQAYKIALRGCDGFAHSLTKNPVSKAWDTFSPCCYEMYELQYLAEFVDFSKLKIEKKIKRPDGFQNTTYRNCTLFNLVREWSYREVHKYDDRLNFEAAVQDRLEELNFELSSPLGAGEVLHIGRSISKWSWKLKHEMSAKFSRRQAWRQKRSVEVRLVKREGKLNQARIFRSEGLTHNEIAKRLGISTKTLQRWQI